MLSIAGAFPITTDANDGRHKRAIADAAVCAGLDRGVGKSLFGSLKQAVVDAAMLLTLAL